MTGMLVGERNHPQVAAMFDVIYIYGIILQDSKLSNQLHRTSLSPLSVSDVAGALSSAGRSRPVLMC